MAKQNEHILALKKMALDALIAKYPNFPYPPQPKYSDKTANGLTKCVIDWLRFNGWQAERINTMGMPKDNTKIVSDCIGRQYKIGSIEWRPTTATKGSSDISAVILGRSVKIEIKIGQDRQSPAQLAYQQSIERAGGTYYIARTFADFVEFYTNFIKTNSK